MKGFVISDLHLFTDRSSTQEIAVSMHNQLGRADFLVLNGDIFDFEWTHLSSVEQTMDEAEQWLGHLARQYPDCVFYYILGNHDAFEPFVQRVNKMTKKLPNLHLCPTHLVLGKNLFFHGDLPLAQKNPWQRSPARHLSKKKSLWHLGYDWAVKCRLHTMVYSLFSPAYCAKRIVSVLQEYPKNFLAEIEHIYFGHTHFPFADFSHGQFSFSNAGAAINGVNANMIKVNI